MYGITIEWCENDGACKDFMQSKWTQFYNQKDCLNLKVINRFDDQRNQGGHPLVDWK